MDPCSIESFPFEFYGTNGSVVAGKSGANGQCIFPSSNCGVDTSIRECCQAKQSVSETGGNFMFIAFAIIFLPYFYLMYNRHQAIKKGYISRGDGDKKSVPSWIANFPILPGVFARLFNAGLSLYVSSLVIVPIFMRQSIQRELTVGDRNAVIAVEAFLVPYNEIFQFVEDIILVRVSYALGAGDHALTNRLVHMGLLGCLFVGTSAALLATVLGVIPASLSALTDPGAANDAQLYPGCDLIEESSTHVLPYWLIEVWGIPGKQLGMVLSGFLLGSAELATLGWIGVLSLMSLPIIWFTAVNSASNKLLVLGIAEASASLLLPLLCILYLISPLGRDLREHTGVYLSCDGFARSLGAFLGRDEMDEPGEAGVKVDTPSPASGLPATEKENGSLTNHETASVENEPSVKGPESTRKLLLDGLKIMVMDVAIQFCLSLGIYLALVNNAADGYKLTALQSALPAYGIAYALGMGIMFKVVGPLLIAKKAFKAFAGFAFVTVVCAFLLVPLILGSVLPFRKGMAFDYGENACSYAKDELCVDFFTNVFGPNAAGGTFTLISTFDVFPLAASVEAVFFVLRATLLAMVDLDFMLRGTLAAVVAYIPAIVVASTVQPFAGEATAFVVAMYVPQAVLIVLFTVRLPILIKRLLRDQKLPA